MPAGAFKRDFGGAPRVALADDLAPYVSLANLLGFGAALWLLFRAKKLGATPLLGVFTWIILIGTGLHLLNDYVAPLVGFDTFADDAYDHVFIHVVLLAALVALVLTIDREANSA